jgi:transcription elongation factor Elf1
MYQCFHCLSNSVVWQSDFSFEDFGYEGEGIVHILVCSNCGSEIEIRVPLNKEENE